MRAGNGGFIELVLKKGISKEEIQNRLDENFNNREVKVWKVELEQNEKNKNLVL